MSSTSIPRQLSVFTLVLAVLSSAAAAIFVLMLIRAYDESARASAIGAQELTQAFTVLERVSSGQDAVQRLVRTKDADKLEAALAEIESDRKRTRTIAASLGERGAAIRSQYENAVAAETQVVDAVLKGDVGTANERFMDTASPAYEAAKVAVRDYFAVAQQRTATALDAQAARARTQVLLCLLVGGVGLAAMLYYVWAMRWRIATRLGAVAATLLESGAQLGDTAAQVTSSSQSVAEGVNRQAAALEETSASLEEIGATASQNAGHAEQAKELAAEAKTAAEAGHNDMRDMIAAMDAIKSASGDIAGIIKTIDEIAFQTNILALNAAVEAARAGQAGLGFAVVSDEVRALAQRAAAAARETSSSVEQVIEKSQRGVEVSGKVARSLGDIVARARHVDSLVAHIAGASSQQRSGIEQVSSALADIEKVTQAGAASAEETAATVMELNTQTDSLRRVVAELQSLTGLERLSPAARSRAAAMGLGRSASRAA